MLGHSEGSIYVPFVMRGSKDVAFVIMQAGIGVPIREIREHTRAGGYRRRDLCAPGYRRERRGITGFRAWQGPEIWKVIKSRTKARSSPLVCDPGD